MKQKHMKIIRNQREIQGNNKLINSSNKINKYSNLNKNCNKQMKNHKIHQFVLTLFPKILTKNHLQAQKSSQKNPIQFYSTKMILVHNLSYQRFLIDKPHIIFHLHLYSQVTPRNSHIKGITMNKCHFQPCQMWNIPLSRSKNLQRLFFFRINDLDVNFVKKTKQNKIAYKNTLSWQVKILDIQSQKEQTLTFEDANDQQRETQEIS